MTKPASFLALASALFFCFSAAPASAFSVVTYVSGTGTDTGACATPATACRSFQYAFNQTFPGGEIKALDAADYFPVTINRSVNISGVEGAGIIRFNAGTAITINAGPSGVVNISNLSLDGFNRTATNGIVLNSGGKLTIVNCKVRRFSGIGIYIVPSSGATDVSISDTIGSDNGTGVSIYSAGSAIVYAVISRTTVASNSNVGIAVRRDTGILAAMVIDSVALKNGTGYHATSGTLYLRRSVAFSNGVGTNTSVNDGLVASYSDNSIDANTSDHLGYFATIPTK